MKFYSFLIILFLCLQCAPKKQRTVSQYQLRKANISKVLKQDQPLLTTAVEGNPAWLPKFKKSTFMESFWRQPDTQNPMLNEIMLESEARPSDYVEFKSHCPDGSCRKILCYNYPLNTTIVAIFNEKINSFVDFQSYPHMQPPIPEHLGQLAIEIAQNDDKVQKGWGCAPGIEDSRMEATKTTLRDTKCQRSNHLCAAPTFVKGDRALWAIVDLTDLEVVGTKWTSVGTSGPALSERVVQNDVVMDCFCMVENEVAEDDWSLDYVITRSDGLEVKNISYKNVPIFHSVKVVDWHVSYSQADQFGYSDAIGCPEFSQAAVIAINPPVIKWIIEEDTLGFVVEQDYFSNGWPTPCSYNYRQRFEFYRDGRFRPAVASLGRGCGVDGTYRPVTRISPVGESAVFQRKKEGQLALEEKESWFKIDGAYEYTEKGQLALIQSDDYKINLIPNRGQFNDGSKGEEPYIYLTQYHPGQGEGDEDLPTIGPCCNVDYKQGPEKFINQPPERINDSEWVLWYVPEIKNDGRKGKEYCWAESTIEDGKVKTRVFPCYSGAAFDIEI